MKHAIVLLSASAAAVMLPLALPLSAPLHAQAAAASFRMDGPALQGSLLRGSAPEGTVRLTLDGTPVPLAKDGRFILGFDRDRTGTATLQATLADGRTVAQLLPVGPRNWSIEHIDALSRPAKPDPAYMKIREGELARIEAARSASSESDGWRQHFIWPVKGRISGQFGSQRIYRGVPAAFHTGVDIAPGAGKPVVAPADGVVVLAGPPMFSLEGNLVIIDHGMGLNSAFLHLASYSVHVGQVVKQGDPIGVVGMTGRATGPHLHWSMKWQDARIDPALLIEQTPPPILSTH